MDPDEAERRYNIIAEARETLARTAHIEVVRRDHRDDGLLTEWSVGMPPKPPPPTAAEVRQMIRDALAEHARDVDSRVAAALAKYHESKDTPGDERGCLGCWRRDFQTVGQAEIGIRSAPLGTLAGDGQTGAWS